MSPPRLVVLAIGTQSLLILVAWLASRGLQLNPSWGEPRRDIVIGLLAALVLAAINYVLLEHLPGGWIVDGVRAVYRELLIPLFSRVSRPGIVLIGIAAGIGEEWLFRGVLQPTLGLAPASILFGLAHVGGSRMLPFGVWATAMGFALGALAIATGGLLAPIVAHGVYDIVALEYIRRGAHQE
jgi:membrane protease YdiL (CAAX protease family)